MDAKNLERLLASTREVKTPFDYLPISLLAV
jgi:hypothetical protein